jgi:hypothetical protein
MISNFQTIVKIPDFKWKTGYQKLTFFIGSCFTENIGNKLSDLKYPVDINPFGILYNPISVAHGLHFLLQNKKFVEEDLILHDGLWHSFFHHGRFSSPDAKKTVLAINERIESSSLFLKKASFLFLSFGTAWVYEYKTSGQTVSNCHKIPDKEFRRFRLTPGEIVEEYRQILGEIWKINPELKVIFTVSPIRHWKDGAIENQRSKSTLLLAADQIIRGFGEDRCNYFPSYEIMMDELRDYRFYDEDMIHLSSSAINHIWNIFQKSLIDEESQIVSKKVQNILSAVNHKPANMFTQRHLGFLSESLQKTNQLSQEYPYLNLACEKKLLSDRINTIRDNNKANELSQI